LLRAFYTLNPLLPCRAPGMSSSWIVTVGDLMMFFERTATTAPTDAITGLVTLDIATFIAARGDRRIEMEVNALLTKADGNVSRTAELGLLKDLQQRYHPGAMPALAKWTVARLQPALELWHYRPRRIALAAHLDSLARDGLLVRLLAAVDDVAGRAADRAGAERAAMERAMIDAELASIEVSDAPRLADAEHLGQAVTAAIGLMALLVVAMFVLIR
jgi:hypothetical protein